jgi:hypothetical protein
VFRSGRRAEALGAQVLVAELGEVDVKFGVVHLGLDAEFVGGVGVGAEYAGKGPRPAIDLELCDLLGNDIRSPYGFKLNSRDDETPYQCSENDRSPNPNKG